MSTLAHHMRITGVNVTNDDVDSRQAAVAALQAEWGKITDIATIFGKAADVAAALGGEGKPSEALGKEVETAVQKKASAFLAIERPLDIGIVAGVAANNLIASEPGRHGWTVIDVWAAALWSALGFQVPLADEKREDLRVSVLKAAQERSVAGAEKAREREEVPDFGEVSLVANEEDELVNTVKKATGPTIDALRRNAALDREELDFLWWAQLRRSRLLNRPLDGISETARVVVAGIEGAKLLRRLPCNVHREIVLRTIDSNASTKLAGVLQALGSDRLTIAASYVGKILHGGSTLFPLISAIISGKANNTPASKIDRSAEEWGARALLEAALLKMRDTGLVKI